MLLLCTDLHHSSFMFFLLNAVHFTVQFTHKNIFISNYQSLISIFNLPHLHLASPLGVILFEFCQDLWHQTTKECLGCHVALFA